MDKNEVATLRQAREGVFKLIFEYSFSRTLNERTREMMAAVLPEEGRPYLLGTTDEVVAHYDEMVSLIMTYVKGYSSPERLNRTDLLLWSTLATSSYTAAIFPWQSSSKRQ